MKALGLSSLVSAQGNSPYIGRCEPIRRDECEHPALFDSAARLQPSGFIGAERDQLVGVRLDHQQP